MKASLLDLLILLKNAETSEEVQRFLEDQKSVRFGWLSKEDLEKRRVAAEKSIAGLEKQFRAMEF